MGTRGLLGLIYKGTRKGAYNHHDSYPLRMGQDVVDFLLTLDDEKLKIMLERLEKLQWVESDTLVPDADLEYYEKMIQRDRKEKTGLWRYRCWETEMWGDGDKRRTTWESLFGGAAVRNCLPFIFDGSVQYQAIPWHRLTRQTMTMGRLVNPKGHVSTPGLVQAQADRDEFRAAWFKGIGVQAVSPSTMDTLIAQRSQATVAQSSEEAAPPKE